MLPLLQHEIYLVALLVQLVFILLKEAHYIEGLDWEIADWAAVEDVGVRDQTGLFR